MTPVVSNRTSDLKGREAAIAVRLFAPTQADLIAKKIGMVSGQMDATPAYLKSIGNTSKPTEFGLASFIGFEDNHKYLNFLRGCGFAVAALKKKPGFGKYGKGLKGIYAQLKCKLNDALKNSDQLRGHCAAARSAQLSTDVDMLILTLRDLVV